MFKRSFGDWINEKNLNAFYDPDVVCLFVFKGTLMQI